MSTAGIASFHDLSDEPSDRIPDGPPDGPPDVLSDVLSDVPSDVLSDVLPSEIPDDPSDELSVDLSSIISDLPFRDCCGYEALFSGKDINTLADPFCMLVGVIKRGKYGERLLETIKARTDFQVVSVEVPEILPGFIEDPEEFVRDLNFDPQIFKADLLILYTFHPDLTPEIVRLAGKAHVKAVIIPGGIGRAGSIDELERIAEEYNIHIEVDEICCTLEECGVPAIDQFAEKLGKPELEVETEDGRISRVHVLRGSPCGATWHAASSILGKTVAEAPSLTGLFCQQYPCRAVRGGPGGIHTSGDLHKDAMERALGQETRLVLPEQSRPIKIEPGKRVRKSEG
ncbi:MAG TPA: DUF166 domain-containing protein [Methanothrix sp.]|uniref:DUF166 domain-containing protein n=1 Tax=Methanothrix sp. TaxID=90426 RepID=UPI002BFC8B37|nr:DUF166 domain-containing protein [Methanothrix sp.]HRU76320.1 DUF166 domain-containing protein [Methanothrix sp.]